MSAFSADTYNPGDLAMPHSTSVTRRKALLSVGSVAATTVLSGVPGLVNAQSDRPVRLISSTEQAQAMFRSEMAKYAGLVKKAKLEP
eukprot:gene12702-26756_t